jgi:hypothetical protein
MFKFFTHLWTAAWDLTPEERSRTVRVCSWIAFVLVLIVLAGAGSTAGRVVPAEHPVWEAILQTRLVLVRLVLTVPLLVIGATAAVLLYQLLENTELGRRLLIWHYSDDAHTQATKTRNGGSLLATLLAACILGILLGVLR